MVVSWVQFVNVMRPNSKDVGSPTFVLAAWHPVVQHVLMISMDRMTL